MRHLLCLFTIFLLSGGLSAATFYSRISGNWNAATTWSTVSCGGAAAATVPGAADVVFVCNTHAVSVTANTNVTSITIQNGGTLRTGTSGGGANKSVTVSGNFIILDGGTYLHNNDQVAAATIFNGTESFSANSNFVVEKWSSNATPLINGCNSNFGNLRLSWDPGNFYWNNNGLGYIRTITGNFTVNNVCATYLDTASSAKTFVIGGSLLVDNGLLRFKQAGTGNIIINVTGAVQVINNSFVYGVYQQNVNMTLNASSVNQSAGVFYGIFNADGIPVFNVSGNWRHSGGDFRGIQNTATFSAATPSFTVGSVTFTGGTFMANYSCNVSGAVTNFIVNGNLNITYAAATDLFAMNRLATLSTTATTAQLNMQVNGSTVISGAVAGEFNGNNATGSETIAFNGPLTITNGNNYFNVVPAYGGNGHATNFTVAGNVTVSGGSTFLSAETGGLQASLNANVDITGGIFSIKGSSGTASVNVAGNYNQSGGTLNLYNNASVVTALPVEMTIQGNFQQSAGTINYSNLATCTAVNIIRLNGALYTISGAGTMTRAGAGTSPIFGFLHFNRQGTISFSRAGTHGIQQVKQVVMPACTLDVVSGNVQIASSSIAGTDYFTVSNTAVLDLRASQLFSNVLAVNSGVSVVDGGRIRTAHPQGWYNNSSAAALNNAGAMNFNFGPLSILEYYAAVNQIATGINLGLATAAQHKYGILEINQSLPGVWVTPTNLPSASGNVFVRTELRLTQGILNLANASAGALSGGRDITIENPAPSGITRVNGLIIAETADYSGSVNWQIGANALPHTVPFAHSNLQNIPLVYTLSGGNAGSMRFSTYNTPASNLPWPSSVNNLNSLIGLSPDNRDATVDRFWLVQTNASPVASVTFSYIASELPISPYNVAGGMRAQHYDLSVNKWQPALPGQSASAYAVTVPLISTQRNWTLSNSSSPLPVEWLSFAATPQSDCILLNWSTAAEKNNDYFIIERSRDLVDVEQLGVVDAMGNTVTVSEYAFRDVLPLSGITYYRIRQVDNDGANSVTEWKAVTFSRQQLPFYPVPSSGVLYLRGIDGNSRYLIYDVAGRKLIDGQVFDGRSEKSIDISSLPPGAYSAIVICEEEVVAHQRIVVN